MSVSPTVFNDINPIAQQAGVPTSVWEIIAQQESGFNPSAIGDNGTSFGIFQLHKGGQLPAQYDSNPQAVLDPTLNATIAMPDIAKAWSDLGPQFNDTITWWESFASQSGHPGGNTTDPATVNEATALMNLYNTGTYGQLTAGSSTSTLGFNTPSLSIPGIPSSADIGTFLIRASFFGLGAVLALVGGYVIATGETSPTAIVQKVSGVLK